MDHYLIDDIGFFIDQNNIKPIYPPQPFISQYIQDKRILPPNTPFPGPWQNERTPYSIEIMDNMSPFSPVTHGRIMKGAQLGLTAAAENVIAYWMDENPTEILFVSATKDLLLKWSTKRLDPLIDSCGFRDKISAQTENKKSRRSGDVVYTKEYLGGSLDMVSARAAASLRSESKRILIRDEIDGAPSELRTGEGNWLDVSEARTNAWGIRKKIMDFSTPGTFENSEINGLYEEGDQRKYFVPCPYCHKHQILDFGNEKSTHGLKADYKAGKLIEAYYVCEFCQEAIFNFHKTNMLIKGYWQPTSKTYDETIRSYHLSSLYSPVGMLSWTDMWKKYIVAQKNPGGMRSFINLYLGLPFKEIGSRPKLEKVIELRGTYRSGTVPEGVLYLTGAIDVQAGSKTDELNPPRLEMEILGMGAGYRTWSIEYKRIEGDIKDPYGGAWEKLNKWAMEGGLTYYRKDGFAFNTNLIFIDSSDGNMTDIVYRFSQRWENTYPIKGFSALKLRKKDITDAAGPANFRRYRMLKSGDLIIYQISTNYYKTQIYNNLNNISRTPLGLQRAGFCDFPIDYGENYFKMLIAEEKKSDGSFHCPSGRRNEALDCRVYNLCAADVFLNSKVDELRAIAKSKGASPIEIQNLNRKTIIDMLAQKTQSKISPIAYVSGNNVV